MRGTSSGSSQQVIPPVTPPLFIFPLASRVSCSSFSEIPFASDFAAGTLHPDMLLRRRYG